MTRVYYTALLTLALVAASPVHAEECPWWDLWCTPTVVEESRDTTIYEAPTTTEIRDIDRSAETTTTTEQPERAPDGVSEEERAMTAEATFRWSNIETEAWSCVDKKTVRKTNLMLMYDGNYLSEDIKCAQDEICLTPEEINLKNIVKWDEVEMNGKIYGSPGQILTEAEAKQLISSYLPHAMCKPIATHNDTCENQNLSATAYYVISVGSTTDPTLPVTKYGIFHTEVCAAGTTCVLGQCVDPTTITCVDGDKGGVGKNHPYFKPSKVSVSGTEYMDVCKDDALLLERSCDGAELKSIYVSCTLLGGKCTYDSPTTPAYCKAVEGLPIQDQDKDGIADPIDNCPTVANTDQAKGSNGDWGDACYCKNANSLSGSPSVSSDGRFVAFRSSATNLVPGSSSEFAQIYVRDRLTKKTEWISKNEMGKGANGLTDNPLISADGRYVAFLSVANNLIPTATDSKKYLYIWDRLLGKMEYKLMPYSWTKLVMSPDARYFGFNGVVTPKEQYVWDRITNKVSIYADEHVSDDEKYTISPDGAYWVGPWKKYLPGLNKWVTDIVAYHFPTGKLEFISVPATGTISDGNSYISSQGGAVSARGNAISGDGRYIVFVSAAHNLLPTNVPGEINIFIRDRLLGKTEWVNVTADGQGVGKLPYSPTISSDARYVSFVAYVTNPATPDQSEEHVYVKDRQTGALGLASVSSQGEKGNDHSYSGNISANGQYVVFTSDASNLVPGDSNGTPDVFIRDHILGKTERISVPYPGLLVDDPLCKPIEEKVN